MLPVWWKTLEDLKLTVTIMPHDVTMRWNSTYDMLEYALNHHQAVDSITQHCDLQKYELSHNEWWIFQQLHDVLKICALHLAAMFNSIMFICRS